MRLHREFLNVSQLGGDVDIKTHEGVDVIVTFTATTAEAANLRTSVGDDGRLTVDGYEWSITMDGEDQPTVTILMPAGLPLAVEDIGGNLSIGNTGNEVCLALTESESCRCGRIGRLITSLTGEVHVDVERVEGDIIAALTDDCSLLVRGGDVPALTVRCSNSADFTFKGQAGKVLQTNSGDGRIVVGS